MVAVPTVMGIASIHVYTVSDVPADGLVTREKVRSSPMGQAKSDVRKNGLINHVPLPLPPAEHLQPAAAVRSGPVCSREAGCYSDWVNDSERAHTTSGPGCYGM